MSFHPVEKQVLFSGKKVRLELHKLQKDDGGHRVVELVVHPGAVVVLAFTKDDEVLLIRNRRYAAGQILWELPAGTLEKNEDPINCAGRELLEETGYLAGRLVPLGNFFTSPGILTEKMYAYIAYDLERSETALEEGEEIETEAVNYDRAIEMIREGEIHDGKTIAALLMFDRFHRSKGKVPGR